MQYISEKRDTNQIIYTFRCTSDWCEINEVTFNKLEVFLFHIDDKKNFLNRIPESSKV